MADLNGILSQTFTQDLSSLARIFLRNRNPTRCGYCQSLDTCSGLRKRAEILGAIKPITAHRVSVASARFQLFNRIH